MPKLIGSALDAVRVVHDKLCNLAHEESWVLYVTPQGYMIKAVCLTEGDATSVVIDRKKIIREALVCAAGGLVLFHNHPSLRPEPSVNDLLETERLSEACRLLDLSLMDHIIVAGDKYYSFSEEKTLKYKYEQET